MTEVKDRGWIATSRLLHYGVKGMKWGVRKSTSSSPVSVSVTTKGKKLRVSGGQHHPTSSDAAKAAEIGQIRRKSGARALSNQELQTYQTRLNLEQNVKRLEFNQASPGKKFVLSLLGQTGKNAAQQAANEVASRQVKRMLARGAVTAATLAI
jgi:hypothetical protein